MRDWRAGRLQMAISVDGGSARGKGARRATSADLNLVPFIDVLTCMVSFLLITAVWTQLAHLSVRQKQPGPSGEEAIGDDLFNVIVVVNESGFALVSGEESKPLPLDYQRLAEELKTLKAQHPDKTDVQVASDDRIKFERLIATMDAVLSAGFPDVSLREAAPTSRL
jgi:biopolymer transport protein TolR